MVLGVLSSDSVLTAVGTAQRRRSLEPASSINTDSAGRTIGTTRSHARVAAGAGVSSSAARERRWSPSTSPEYERRLAAYEAEMAELREQAKVLEEEVDLAAPPAPGRAQAGAHAGGAAARDQGPAGPGGVAEREAHLHPARGARAHRRAARRGRQAHPAAVGLRHVARPQRRRHGRRVLRRPQDARRAAPRARGRRARSAAPRSCSTSRSTSCWPAAASSPARSSRSRRCSRTAPGR